MIVRIPDFVLNRIKRPIPPDLKIVERSTPVISFGNFTKATLATLAINPSRAEFLDKNDNELTERSQRFHTLKSLNLASIQDATEQDITEIYNFCIDYFNQGKRPYWKWFKPLKTMLNDVNFSYANGSACHLDLIQWATDPVWGQIEDEHIKGKLLNDDKSFLKQQLNSENFKFILINGKTALNTFKFVTECSLQVDETYPSPSPLELYSGVLNGVIKIIGWNLYLQQPIKREIKSHLRQYIVNAISKS